ncbi:MAG: hypothetical protein NT169_26755 [Chloroflexi bacterium]|nr:hypothetical protein [Chloroflexota bacterium]
MIGPHIIGGIGNYEALFRRWQPRATLLLDPSEGAARTVKNWSPGTFIIGRLYYKDEDVQDRILNDPKGAARWAAQLMTAAAARNREVDVCFRYTKREPVGCTLTIEKGTT